MGTHHLCVKCSGVDTVDVDRYQVLKGPADPRHAVSTHINTECGGAWAAHVPASSASHAPHPPWSACHLSLCSKINHMQASNPTDRDLQLPACDTHTAAVNGIQMPRTLHKHPDLTHMSDPQLKISKKEVCWALGCALTHSTLQTHDLWTH